MDKRRKKLQGILKEKGLDGFIVTTPVNIFYLTGFRGFSPSEREAILIFGPRATLITARLYQNEANLLKNPSLKISIATERNRMNDLIKKLLTNIKRVGFEEGDMKFSEHKKFKKELKGAKFVPSKNLVEEMRAVKSNDEIAKIQKAQIISQKAFEKILPLIKPGMSEQEIAEMLASILKSLGSQGLAFDSIIASGPNSALPHYFTGKRKVKAGDVLLFDFGSKYKNYCADLSRTVFLGKTKVQQAQIWHHVKKAQTDAIAQIQGEMKSEDAFAIVHRYFRKHKLDKHFLHSLGHGIGLEVHEKPHVGPPVQTRFGMSRQTGFEKNEILAEGMVFSIEPGLYFDNWGGVRIEDLVTIKNGRVKILGQSAQFIELAV